MAELELVGIGVQFGGFLVAPRVAASQCAFPFGRRRQMPASPLAVGDGLIPADAIDRPAGVGLLLGPVPGLVAGLLDEGGEFVDGDGEAAEFDSLPYGGPIGGVGGEEEAGGAEAVEGFGSVDFVGQGDGGRFGSVFEERPDGEDLLAVEGVANGVAVGEEIGLDAVEEGDGGGAAVGVEDDRHEAVDRFGAGFAEHAGGEEAEVRAFSVGVDGGVGEEFVKCGVGGVVVEIVVDVAGGEGGDLVGGEAGDGGVGTGEDAGSGIGLGERDGGLCGGVIEDEGAGGEVAEKGGFAGASGAEKGDALIGKGEIERGVVGGAAGEEEFGLRVGYHVGDDSRCFSIMWRCGGVRGRGGCPAKAVYFVP